MLIRDGKGPFVEVGAQSRQTVGIPEKRRENY
jgi:hypothetical protein